MLPFYATGLKAASVYKRDKFMNCSYNINASKKGQKSELLTFPLIIASLKPEHGNTYLI